MVAAPGLSHGSTVTASELERMRTQRINGSWKQPWITWAVNRCSKAQAPLSRQCILGLGTMVVPGRITFQYSQPFLVLKLQFISCILFSESLLSHPVGRVFLIPFSNNSPALKSASRGPKTYSGEWLTAYPHASHYCNCCQSQHLYQGIWCKYRHIFDELSLVLDCSQDLSVLSLSIISGVGSNVEKCLWSLPTMMAIKMLTFCLSYCSIAVKKLYMIKPTYKRKHLIGGGGEGLLTVSEDESMAIMVGSMVVGQAGMTLESSWELRSDPQAGGRKRTRLGLAVVLENHCPPRDHTSSSRTIPCSTS